MGWVGGWGGGGAYILHNGKATGHDSISYRGISLLSCFGKSSLFETRLTAYIHKTRSLFIQLYSYPQSVQGPYINDVGVEGGGSEVFRFFLDVYMGEGRGRSKFRRPSPYFKNICMFDVAIIQIEYIKQCEPRFTFIISFR